MDILIMGMVTAINLAVLWLKFTKARYLDLTLDIIAISLLTTFFGGTMGGMGIAMVASAIITTLLYFRPPKWPSLDIGGVNEKHT